jgi:hypothetical protein
MAQQHRSSVVADLEELSEALDATLSDATEHVLSRDRPRAKLRLGQLARRDLGSLFNAKAAAELAQEHHLDVALDMDTFLVHGSSLRSERGGPGLARSADVLLRAHRGEEREYTSIAAAADEAYVALAACDPLMAAAWKATSGAAGASLTAVVDERRLRTHAKRLLLDRLANAGEACEMLPTAWKPYRSPNHAPLLLSKTVWPRGPRRTRLTPWPATPVFCHARAAGSSLTCSWHHC